VNSSPVVGVVVTWPRPPVAAKWIVSMLSAAEHVGPITRIPDRHSTITDDVPGRTLPERSTRAGLRIVWVAFRITSKPFSASEPLAYTPIFIC